MMNFTELPELTFTCETCGANYRTEWISGTTKADLLGKDSDGYGFCPLCGELSLVAVEPTS
jgi:transcription elongation factor Elf1